MKSFKNWRGERLVEFVATPAGANNEEIPTEEDQQFYNTHLSSTIDHRLQWLIDVVSSVKKLAVKGFILERIIRALGFSTPEQALRVVTNIRNTMRKNAAGPDISQQTNNTTAVGTNNTASATAGTESGTPASV